MAAVIFWHAMINFAGKYTHNKTISYNKDKTKINNTSTNIQLDLKQMNSKHWDTFQQQIIDKHNNWLEHQSPQLNNHDNAQDHVNHLYTIIEGHILHGCKGLPTKKSPNTSSDTTTTTEIRFLNNITYHIYKTLGSLKRWSSSSTTSNNTFTIHNMAIRKLIKGNSITNTNFRWPPKITKTAAKKII